MPNQTQITITPLSKRVYYGPLVRWNLVDEIVFLTEPHEHTQVRTVIVDTLDHVIMEEVLSILDQSHHQSFLVLCQTDYHQSSTLEWLEEKSSGISEKIRVVIQNTKKDLHDLLSGKN
jgi:hypothetical protein